VSGDRVVSAVRVHCPRQDVDVIVREWDSGRSDVKCPNKCHFAECPYGVPEP
jgi:hypothetical protein